MVGRRLRYGLGGLLACSALTAAAGNQPLMGQARQRAFLLNRAVIAHLEHIPRTARIQLEARVKPLPDGSWQVVIDSVNVEGPVEEGQFPFAGPTADAPTEYVTFEQMIPHPGSTQEQHRQEKQP